MSNIPSLNRRRLLQAAGAGSVLLMAGSGQALAAGPDYTMAQLMVPMPLKDLPEGKAGAPVTIIEYASMTCPHCAHFQVATMPQLKKDYLDTGKAVHILREFPLDPLATAAFMLARYAGDDKRNALVDMLFRRQNEWVYVDKQIPALTKLVAEVGITKADFDKCLADKALYDNVNKMRDIASNSFKVDSTPTFFINGRRHEGDFEAKDLADLIKA
ncbi:MAG: DsbA family protein [Hyphomicrobiales bacterium]|nr:DsbA family protein [Hyphomicrobiales bacterium]